MINSTYCTSVKGFRRRPLLAILTLLFAFLGSSGAWGQQLGLADFVLLSGSGGAGTSVPAGSGYVLLSSSSTINGGSIGSFNQVQSTGTASIVANVFSQGTILLANSNDISGRIAAANLFSTSGLTVSIGSNAVIGGDIDANGTIEIGGGSVLGKVTHPAGTSYTGPVPIGGEIIGNPALPVFPALPPVTSFPAAAQTGEISNSATLSPGSYGALTLKGNQTLTLNGPGIYVFSRIENKNANTILFDFKNNPTGKFYIYVHNNAQLEKINAVITGGGSANRIYTEVHGTGFGTELYAFDIANGSGKGDSK